MLAAALLLLSWSPAPAAEPDEPGIRAVREKLRTLVTLDGFEPNTPLADALKFFEERYGFKIVIDEKAIQVRKAPIKLPKVFNVPLRKVLELLISQVRGPRVDKLLLRKIGDPFAPESAQEPQVVDDRGSLYVRLRPYGVEITTARGQHIVRGKRSGRAAPDADELVSRKKLAELRQALRMSVNLDGFEANTPLQEALGFLSERYGVTILVNRSAFHHRLKIEEPENQPVQMTRCVETPLVDVLGMLLAQGNGRCRLRDGYIEIVPEENPGSSLAFAADGRRLATRSPAGSGQVIRVWDRPSGRRLHSLALAERGCQLAFSRDSNSLAFLEPFEGNLDRSVWNIRTGKREPGEPLKVPGTRALAPDGETIASAHEGKLRVWNPRTEGERSEPIQVLPAALAYSLGGRFLFGIDRQPPLTTHEAAKVSQSIAANTVVIWQPGSADGPIHFRLEEAGESMPMASAALSADGRLLATVDALGQLALWETLSGRRIGGILDDALVHAVAFAPTGRLLAALVESRSEPAIEVWDLAADKPAARLQADAADAIIGLAFAPDGKTLAAVAGDGTPIVWDLADLAARRPPAHLTLARLETLWADLRSEDARRGYRTRLELDADPEAAVAFLAGRLKPPGPDRARLLDRALRDLDDDQWLKRNRAEEDLLRLAGREILPRLRRELGQAPSLEKRRRLERILARLPKLVPSPDVLRELRAIQVLESAATPESRRLLEKLARSWPDAPITRAARAALKAR